MVFLRLLMIVIGVLPLVFTVDAQDEESDYVIALVDTSEDFDQIVIYDWQTQDKFVLRNYYDEAETQLISDILDKYNDEILSIRYDNLTWSSDGQVLAYSKFMSGFDFLVSGIVAVELKNPEAPVFHDFATEYHTRSHVWLKPYWSPESGNLITLYFHPVEDPDYFYSMDKGTFEFVRIEYDNPDALLYVRDDDDNSLSSKDARFSKQENSLLLDDVVIYSWKTEEYFGDDPVLSPDGRWVLFSISRQAKHQMIRVNVETLEVDVLYENGHRSVFRPRVDD